MGDFFFFTKKSNNNIIYKNSQIVEFCKNFYYLCNMKTTFDNTANNLMPSEPVHPGTLLKEEIEYRGISQKQLAQQISVSYTVLNEILNGKRPISTDYALYLEAALGIDAQLWIQMQADYNLQVAKNDNKVIQHILNIRKIAAVL